MRPYPSPWNLSGIGRAVEKGTRDYSIKMMSILIAIGTHPANLISLQDGKLLG